MTKKKQRRARGRPDRHTTMTLQETLDRAYVFLRAGQVSDGLALLEPLREKYPDSAPLFLLLGDGYALAEDYYRAVWGYERALALEPERTVLLPNLLNLYGVLEMPMHALQAARRILERDPDNTEIARLAAGIEAETPDVAQRFGVDLAAAAEGSFQAEAGRLALNRDDFAAAVSPLRQAVELFPRWPAPRNNLALALSLLGAAEEARALMREVLEIDPDNVHGLSNMISSLAIAGEWEAARPYWERLCREPVRDDEDAVKVAEAAAYMEEDEAAYRLLRPLYPPDLAGSEFSPSKAHMLLLLAAAAANLGRKEEALQVWARLARETAYRPWVDTCREALQAGRPGPGWAERYPYFSPLHLVREEMTDEVTRLVGDEDRLSDEEMRARGAELARRYPQLVPFAEAVVWVQQKPEFGVPMLRMLGTPRAVAALRRYATSQAGPDEGRKEALTALSRLGALAPDEPVRVWLDGEWREVQVRGSWVGPREWPYAPELHTLMERAVQLGQQKRYREAERVYRQMIATEPRLKEAYANLAAVYAWQGKLVEARALMEQALEIDPLYVFPRCNLALTTLGEGDIAGARQWIEPLAARTEFHPQEAAFYHYVQARILVEEKRFAEARSFLEVALAVQPGYEPALELQERIPWLEVTQDIPGGLEELGERFRQLQRKSWSGRRDRAKRRLQVLDPTVAQVLASYPKAMLTGMARNLLPWGGWSAWKKDRLAEALGEALLDRTDLARVVAGLSIPERALLRSVVEQGSVVPAADLRARHGDEREESPYWEYHQPESPLGRLLVRGLVAVAFGEEQEHVVVPAELRPLLPGLVKGHRRKKRRGDRPGAGRPC
ncbi:MAG: tetratricopeptide repeat protein [Anaerolineae bacterium]|nr:tetratricopeptide repeat protein [Anaerolineae bacterium]